MSFAITDPFFRRLYKDLSEQLTTRVNGLATGTALSIGDTGHADAIATAFRYRADVSYIQALQEVIELCRHIDKEIYGTKDKNEDGDE